MKPIIEEKLNEIKIPNSLHERCLAGVMKAKRETEADKVNKNRMKKTAAAAAVMVVCILGVGNTAMADSIKGFFKNITRWDGAITGTEYVQASDEVEIKAGEVMAKAGEYSLPVEITFLNKDKAPFNEMEMISMNAFKIVDANGNIVVSVEDAGVMSGLNNGKAQMELVIDKELTAGETYTLVIETFEGSKKADAPLIVKGDWECPLK